MPADAPAAMRVEQELFVRALLPAQPPTRVVGQLAAAMRDVVVSAEEVLFAPGAPSRTIYLVVGGAMVLEAPGESPWRFESGAMVGVTDAAQGRPHTRTARGAPWAQLLAIEYEEYLDILEDNFGFATALMENRCRMIHAQARNLRPDEVFAEEDREGVAAVGRPTSLELSEVDRLLVLREVRAFRTAPAQPLATLARNAFTVRANPGEPVFHAGDAADALFVVAAGRVIVQDARVELEFGPGSVLCSAYGLACAPRGYHAVACTPASLVVVTREDLYDVMEDHFGLARCLFAWLARENERTRQRAT